jgi:hypothetical protein
MKIGAVAEECQYLCVSLAAGGCYGSEEVVITDDLTDLP